jgi:hypothetical protein
MRTIKINNIPLPEFYDDECYPPPPRNRKRLAQTRRRGRRRGISLRGHRTYYIAIYVIVELAIIGGIRRTALYRGLIKSAFLMYFHLYIILNITLLLKH